jgi:hypothetical protein
LPIQWRLEVLEGPRSGEKIPLKQGPAVLIGRTKQGIDLLDPRVSSRHAEIFWKSDRYFIRDLESATGTLVDGMAAGHDPVPLSNKTRLLIGDTLMLVVEDRRLLPQWVYWVALMVLVLSTPGFISLVWEFSLPWAAVQPVIQAPESVTGPRGAVFDSTQPQLVPLDRCFMRELEADASNSRIRLVKDFNSDGVSEIWVEGANYERIYTFGADSDWLLLAELPRGCTFTEGAGFVPLSCGPKRFTFQPGVPFQPSGNRCAKGSNLGQYTLEGRRGVVAWVPETTVDGAPTGYVKPFAIEIKGENNIPTWLGERGIGQPVHFVVCEEMFPGMGAQVLTAGGRIERLQPGCGATLELGGAMLYERYHDQRPLAVAFSETGRRLLVEQLNVFLGGAETQAFQFPAQKAWSNAVAETPFHDTATYMTFSPSPLAPVRFFPWDAQEDARLSLGPRERLTGLVVPGRLRASTWRWLDDVDRGFPKPPCGNASIRIETFGWRCGITCVRNSTPFMSITHSDGTVWTVPYDTVEDLRLYGSEVELEVDVRSGPPGLVRQVVSATVAVRGTQVCGIEGEVPYIPTEQGDADPKDPFRPIPGAKP